MFVNIATMKHPDRKCDIFRRHIAENIYIEDLVEVVGYGLRRGSQIQLSTPDSDSTANRQPSMSLVKAVARARGWYEQIVNGKISTVRELAQKCNLPRRYVRRILTCAILSPRIIEALLIGQHRRNLTLDETLASVSLDWRKQEERILR